MSNSLILDELRELSSKLESKSSYIIIYSDDADGVASASIFSVLIDTLKGQYDLVCLDKLLPEALTLIFNKHADYYIFLDLGGTVHHYIPEYIDEERMIVIDHHEEIAAYPERLWYINPYKYGYTGEYATSSTISYFIYRLRFSAKPELAAISLIGIGEVEGDVKGLNWYAFTDAYSGGKAGKKSRGRRTSYYIKMMAVNREINSFYKDITLLSSVGYYEDGPLLAVESLVFNDYELLRSSLESYKQRRANAYKDGINYLEDEGLFQLDYVQWFKDPGHFTDMGTRVFDSFTSYVRYQGRLISKNKYILGIMERRTKVPGLGELEREWANVAIRVPRYLETAINANIAQPVSALAGPVAYQVDGMGYGYKHLGAAVIPSANEDEYVKLFNELAKYK